MRGASRAGAVFLVLFGAAFVVSLNDLVGTFADADRFFEERFDDGATRVRDIAASYLLVAAGLAFGWFAHRVAAVATVRAQAILLSGVAAAAGMVGAAVAFATVPMSRWFGDLVDDPGLQDGQAVLPQPAGSPSVSAPCCRRPLAWCSSPASRACSPAGWPWRPIPQRPSWR
jgi:hypothetical protein